MFDFFFRIFIHSFHLLLLLMLLASCSDNNIQSINQTDKIINSRVDDTGKRIINADSEPYNWLSAGRDYQEARYSPLSKINTDNITELGLDWFYDLDTSKGQEATPLVVDGIVFTTSAWSKVQAFDGRSGRLLWQFDPEVAGETGGKACCDVVNRGAAFWNDKVYVGSLDGRLIAIDANTGKQVWSVVTVDQSKPYTITGAPRIVKGKVIIGNGGAELGVRGYVTAYDAETGEKSWRFYTVPGEPGVADGEISDEPLAKLAADTWSGDWWKDYGGGGGGTVWDSMAYDPELDLLFLGVGNGSFWNKKYRGSGDNLFVASILALKPDTGEYVWHYQQTPGDEWDYTSTQHMIVTDLTINGVVRKVLMQAPKNGFFYVIDRITGQPISAEPFVNVSWASKIDLETGRPVVNPAARYSGTDKLWVTMPGPHGAHGWNPMSYSKDTGYVYIPVNEVPTAYKDDPNFEPLPNGLSLGLDPDLGKIPDDHKKVEEIRTSLKGYLQAWDPIRQKEVWRAENPAPWNGGIVSTAGDLVFQGDVDGYLNAYDAMTGEKLWSFDVGSAVIAPPVSYAINGKQYVTVLAGWGGAASNSTGRLGWSKSGMRINKSRVLTFSLNGEKALPPRKKFVREKLLVPQQFGNEQSISQGEQVYLRTCVHCHGPQATSSGGTPDLRYSGALASEAAWRAIVYDGVLGTRGMIGFKDNFSLNEVEAVRAYVINQAAIEYKTQNSNDN